MPITPKNTINKRAQKKFQGRLAHYLRRYAEEDGLTFKEVAQKLNYHENKFYTLIKADVPHGRFISSLDFLKSLANLKKLSIGDFISLLEEGPDIKLETTDKDELILKAFKSLKSSNRKKFIEFLAKSKLASSSERELFAEIMDLVILLIEKNDLKKVQSIKNMLI